jgi:hypothetical protein
MRALAACGLLLAATVFAGDVDVQSTAGGRVSVRVGSAPLSEVLDRLARQTGMKVIYDGAPPRALVRGRHVEDVTPAEAVLNVLEGLGVGYALRFDPDGVKVETLLVVGTVGTAGPSGPRPIGAPPALRPPVGPPAPPLIMEEPDEDSSAGQSPNIEELFSARPGREEKEEPPQMGPPTGPPAPFPGFPNILPAPQAPATPAPTNIGPMFLTPPTPAPSPPPQ